jgi:hypothetical protein
MKARSLSISAAFLSLAMRLRAFFSFPVLSGKPGGIWRASGARWALCRGTAHDVTPIRLKALANVPISGVA